MKRISAVVVIAGCLVLPTAIPGSAGGAVWHFDGVEYAPGEIAEAYTSVSWGHNGSLGRPEGGPYLLYLDQAGAVAESWPGIPEEAMLVGIVEINLSPYWAEDGLSYGPYHAIARFEIPQVAPGQYQILHCNEPCTTMLGDIIGGWGLTVKAGSAGRSPGEIADEVRIALESYPVWETAPDPEIHEHAQMSSLVPPINPGQGVDTPEPLASEERPKIPERANPVSALPAPESVPPAGPGSVDLSAGLIVLFTLVGLGVVVVAACLRLRPNGRSHPRHASRNDSSPRQRAEKAGRRLP